MFTRHGWTAVVAAAASVGTGRLFGVMELYVLGAGLAAVALAALVTVNLPSPRLAVQRIARPGTVAVGEPARVDIRLVNQGGRRAPHLRLWEPVGERGGAPMQIAPLRGGDAATAAYRVPTSHRGVVTVGPLRAERSDLLGLARRTRVLAGHGEVLVVPERVPLAFPSLTSNGMLGTHLRMKAMGRSGTEFHSQREYVPGDDLRRINWKSSARTDTLIVREPALEGVHHCTVLLDTDSGAYDTDGFERAVSAAASVVTAATGHGIASRLVAPGLDVRGPDMAHEALRWLALVQTGTSVVDAMALASGHAEGMTLLVVVTASASAASVRVAAGTAGPDTTIVIVATMPGGEGQSRFTVAAPSLMALERNWQHLVEGPQG